MKRIFWVIAVLVLFGIGLVMSSCGPKSKVPEGEVLVTVEDKIITVGDFNREWQRNRLVSPGLPPESVGSFLNDMIVEKLFIMEARRRKIDQSTQFREEMDNYRNQLLVEALLNKEVLSISSFSPAEIEKYWQDHKAEFSVPELIRVSHILIKTKEGEGDEEVKARVQEVLDRLKSGEDFTQVALELSEGGSSIRGGDLGYFRPGLLAPELEEQAWSLEKGKTSGSIKTQYGYHIIRVTDRKAPREKSLEEARNGVITVLRAQKRKARFDELESRLKRITSIKVDEAALNKLQANLGNAP